jgi:hypothetical protein
MHQQDVDHGGLVDDQQIAFEPVVGIPFEAAAFQVNLQPPVDGLGLEPGGFGHALGGTARRGAQQQAHALGGEDAQDRVDDGRLAYPGPAGNDEHLRQEGQSDRGDLTFGQRQTGLLLDPRQCLLRVDVGPGQFSIGQAQYPLGNDLLGPVEACEENADGLPDRIGDDRSLGQFQI